MGYPYQRKYHDLHRRWNHRWVTPKAEARKSPIHGTGVFAKEKIKKGEVVAVLGGVIVPKWEIEEYWKKMGHVGIQINDDFYIVPTTREELDQVGVFNHSCDPNIGFRDSLTLVAIRDIEPGEELVFDYAFSESNPRYPPFKCNCGSPNCRGWITPDDWKRPEIWEKYFDYFSPYLKEKIKKLREGVD